MDKKGIIFDIQRGSFVDGPGVRTTIFFKGCNLRCAWCHNPESQAMHKQMMLFASKCICCGKCKSVCPNSLKTCSLCGKCAFLCPQDAREISGKEYSVENIIDIVVSDKSYYESSGGGVTLSGGESMLQIDFLTSLLIKLKEHGIHTAIDTAGHVPYEYFKKILPYTDMFLYDIKTINNEKHKKYTSVDNTLILENLKKLLKSGKHIWVRIPVIDGVNSSIEEMEEINAFFKEFGYPQKIELLPYHAMGEHKYTALSLDMPRFKAPEKELLEHLKAIFK